MDLSDTIVTIQAMVECRSTRRSRNKIAKEIGELRDLKLTFYPTNTKGRVSMSKVAHDREMRRTYARRRHKMIRDIYDRDTKVAINDTITYMSASEVVYVTGGTDNKTTTIQLQQKSIEDFLLKEYTPTKHGKTAVLNFSSYKRPGGKYLDGSTAQEESICKVTNLYEILMAFQQSFYNVNGLDLNEGLYRNHMLYTPGVAIVRENRSLKGKIDVITCAAPNLCNAYRCGKIENPEFLERLEDTLHSRIEMIFAAAAANMVKTLVLGAYGCGVFKNDPTQVAEIMKVYVDKFIGKTSIQNVIFIIPDKPHYDIFSNVLCGDFFDQKTTEILEDLKDGIKVPDVFD